MTPRQARRILREMNRRDRRDLATGLYALTVDGGRTFYDVDRHGIPRLARIGKYAVAPTAATITREELERVVALLNDAPVPDIDRHILSGDDHARRHFAAEIAAGRHA